MAVTTLCSRCAGHGMLNYGESIADCPACGCAGSVWPPYCDKCGSFGSIDKPCKRCARIASATTPVGVS